MAESREDKDVDMLINDLQSTLNKLKAAQRKDVADEDVEESGEKPKNLKEAGDEAYRQVKASRAQAAENDRKPS